MARGLLPGLSPAPATPQAILCEPDSLTQARHHHMHGRTDLRQALIAATIIHPDPTLIRARASPGAPRLTLKCLNLLHR